MDSISVFNNYTIKNQGVKFFLCIHSISKPEGVIKGRNQIVGSEGMLRRAPMNANLCQANLMHNDVTP